MRPGWIGSLQPDRLAELHVRARADRLTRSRPGVPDRPGRPAGAAGGDAAGPRVGPTTRTPRNCSARRCPAPPISSPACRRRWKPLMTIFNAIPDQTVILAPAAAALCQRILSLLPASTDLAVRAYWLRNLATRLAALGRPAEALTADQGSRRDPPGAGRRQPGPLPPRPRHLAEQPRHLVLGAGPPGRRGCYSRRSYEDPRASRLMTL